MPDDSKRLDALRADIAGRLRTVCQALPRPEFDELVARIADLEYKYEQMPGRFPQNKPRDI